MWTYFKQRLSQVYYPTRPESVPLAELGWSNLIYLADNHAHRDPTMVWGTTVELEAMDEFLIAQSRKSNAMLSIVHVLIKAVSQSLIEHPCLNRRVVGRSVYPYDGISMVVPIRRPSDGIVDVVFFKDTASLELKDVAARMWEETRNRAVLVAKERNLQQHKPRQNCLRKIVSRWQLRIIRRMVSTCFSISNRYRLPSWSPWGREFNGANAFVNFLGFPGAPPMISYKPSSLPTNSFSVSVTMGAAEQKPVVHDGQIVIRKVAPIFVRVDHRLVNGHQAGKFIATLRSYLSNPSTLMNSNSEDLPVAA